MDYIFKVLKEKSGKPWSLYLTKLAFKIEKESKTFPDKQTWEFVTTSSAIQKNIEGCPSSWNESKKNKHVLESAHGASLTTSHILGHKTSINRF